MLLDGVILAYQILTFWRGFAEAAVSFSLFDRSKSVVCKSGLLRDVDNVTITGLVLAWRGDLVINQITSTALKAVIQTFCHINTEKSPCQKETDPDCACLLYYDPAGYLGYYVHARRKATTALSQATLHVQLGSNYTGGIEERTPYLHLSVIYDYPSVTITVDDVLSLPLTHCRHTFDFAATHRFKFCTENLNNPLLTIHIGHTLHQSRSRPCLVSQLPLLESTTVGLSYVDDCSRSMEYYCAFTEVAASMFVDERADLLSFQLCAQTFELPSEHLVKFCTNSTRPRKLVIEINNAVVNTSAGKCASYNVMIAKQRTIARFSYSDACPTRQSYVCEFLALDNIPTTSCTNCDVVKVRRPEFALLLWLTPAVLGALVILIGCYFYTYPIARWKRRKTYKGGPQPPGSLTRNKLTVVDADGGSEVSNNADTATDISTDTATAVTATPTAVTAGEG